MTKPHAERTIDCLSAYEVCEEQVEVVATSVSDVPLLRVTGDIDHYCAPAFQEAVYEALGQSDSRLLLDFSACPYLDSGGLAVVLSALKSIRGRGFIGLIGSNSDLLRIFEISGISGFPEFRLFTTREEASAALTGTVDSS